MACHGSACGSKSLICEHAVIESCRLVRTSNVDVDNVATTTHGISALSNRLPIAVELINDRTESAQRAIIDITFNLTSTVAFCHGDMYSLMFEK